MFSYKVYIQIYIPLSCITVIKYLDCNDIFNSLPTVTSSASVFVCNCLTDISFNLNLYWSQHCDTTVDHPAYEQSRRIELPSSAWQADIISHYTNSANCGFLDFSYTHKLESHVSRLIALAYAYFLYNIYYVIQLYSHRIFL